MQSGDYGEIFQVKQWYEKYLKKCFQTWPTKEQLIFEYFV